MGGLFWFLRASLKPTDGLTQSEAVSKNYE